MNIIRHIPNFVDCDRDFTPVEFNSLIYSPQILAGWQFKSLLDGCYAAIPMPPWENNSDV